MECLTPKFYASLFNGSLLQRLHIFMSALTHSDQVILGFPLPQALGIVILVMCMKRSVMCPNHLRRLVSHPTCPT